MDFDNLDLREAEALEYWVHLRLGDTLLFADMDKQERPCRVKVASVADQRVEDALKAVQRASTRHSSAEGQYAAANRAQRKDLEQRLNSAEKETEAALTNFLAVSIRDWENIEKGGEPLPYSADALADYSAPKAPLFRLASSIAEDAASAQSPFGQPARD